MSELEQLRNAFMERTDISPQEALLFYADQRNFDIVAGHVRIIDNGAVASNALKHLDLSRLELKGDAELAQLREELATARRTAGFWKANHLAGNEELAARDLVIERMREGIQTFIDEHEECEDADGWLASVCSQEALHVADELLALHPSTEALRDRDRKRDAALLREVAGIAYSDTSYRTIRRLADKRLSGEWEPELEVK